MGGVTLVRTGLEARVGADREVARVRLRLGQEARAGDGVVDLRLGPPRRPILQERGCEQRVQFRTGIEEGIGLGRGVIGREVHVAQGICNLLIHFGPRVEVEQRGDDLGIDLAAVVVAGQGRGDGRGHRAAGGVVGQLAGHEARHLPLVPVGHQGRGDEGQHLRLVLELGQVQGVDGGGDRCARFRLGVGFAAGVAVRLDEDGVVQVLEGGGQGAGHRQVPQHIATPEQVEGRAAVPGLAVAQRHRRRDGGVRLGRGIVGSDGRRDGGVRLDAGVAGREGCRDGGVPLGRRPVGHQGIGDGLGRLCRVAVIGQLRVRVALALVDGRHHGDGDFGSREVVGQSRGGRHRDVPVQADASVGEAGQQRAVFLADGDQGVLDLEVARRALQLGRLHEGGGGEAVDRQIGGGGDAAAVLQGGDAAVDGRDVRLQGADAAVDGRDRAAERVEGGHQGVAAVALGLAPAVRLDLDDAPVAQDRPSGEGRPEEQAADDLGRELVLDEVEKAVAFGHRRIPSEVPGVERREVAVAQVPPVSFRFRIGVAGELERGFREDGVGRQGRPGQEGLDHGRRHVGAHRTRSSRWR